MFQAPEIADKIKLLNRLKSEKGSFSKSDWRRDLDIANDIEATEKVLINTFRNYSYPVILLPLSVIEIINTKYSVDILESYLKDINIPIRPRLILTIPDRPIVPEFKDQIIENYTAHNDDFWVFLSIIFSVISYLIGGSFLVSISILVLLIFLIKSNSSSLKAKKKEIENNNRLSIQIQYRRDCDEYSRKVRNNEINQKYQFNLALKEYEERMEKESISNSRYDACADYIKNGDFQKVELFLKAQKIKEVLKLSIVPIELKQHPWGTNRGITEDAFFNHFNNVFPGKIFRNIGLKRRYDRGIEYLPYQPDLCYIDSDKSIFIDLEIDEPYNFSDKKPTHLIHKDFERDKFFLNSNWFVIRFSEKQALDSNFCIQLLYEFLSFIEHPQNFTFLSINQSKIEKRWDEDAVAQLIAQQYREILHGM